MPAAITSQPVWLSGSSPHGRGDASRSIWPRCGLRFIPARAGRPRRRGPGRNCCRVHPRARGVGRAAVRRRRVRQGSSPRARVAAPPSPWLPAYDGSSPRAGWGRSSGPAASSPRVHPRVCGVGVGAVCLAGHSRVHPPSLGAPPCCLGSFPALHARAGGRASHPSRCLRAWRGSGAGSLTPRCRSCPYRTPQTAFVTSRHTPPCGAQGSATTAGSRAVALGFGARILRPNGFGASFSACRVPRRSCR